MRQRAEGGDAGQNAIHAGADGKSDLRSENGIVEIVRALEPGMGNGVFEGLRLLLGEGPYQPAMIAHGLSDARIAGGAVQRIGAPLQIGALASQMLRNPAESVSGLVAEGHQPGGLSVQRLAVLGDACADDPEHALQGLALAPHRANGGDEPRALPPRGPAEGEPDQREENQRRARGRRPSGPGGQARRKPFGIEGVGRKADPGQGRDDQHACQQPDADRGRRLFFLLDDPVETERRDRVATIGDIVPGHTVRLVRHRALCPHGHAPLYHFGADMKRPVNADRRTRATYGL